METVRDRFAIDDILTFISSFSQRPLSVAFQFPDEELAYAPFVLSSTRTRLEEDGVQNVDVYLLGDTTYAACCVDEVGAAHINANALVHFGHTCFSPPENLPVLYVLGDKKIQSEVNIQECASALATRVGEAIANNTDVGLVWDPDCTALLPELLQEISKLLGNQKDDSSPILIETESSWFLSFPSPHESLIIPRIPKAFFPKPRIPKSVVGNPQNTSEQDSDASQIAQDEDSTSPRELLRVCGLEFPPRDKSRNLEIVYLGDRSYRSQTIVAEHSPSSIVRIDPHDGSIDPISKAGVRLLTSRYGLVDRIKAADSIGIVAGTLAVAHHSELINTLRLGLKASRKGVYTFCVGRINTPKLANFATDVEAFILVACPEAVMALDGSQHVLPIASPYEAMLALYELVKEAEEEYYYDNDEQESPELQKATEKDAISWEGRIDLSLSSLLKKWKDSNLQGRLLLRQTQNVAPHFSTSTGKLVSPNEMYELGREDGNMDSDQDEDDESPSEQDANKNESQALVDMRKNQSDVLTLLSGTAGSVAARKLVSKRQWRGLQYERESISLANPASDDENSCTELIVADPSTEPQYSQGDLTIVQGQFGVAQGYQDMSGAERMK